MSDLDKVKQLRKSTGAGFKDCNNSLKESNGDIEKAIEILRVKGISKASKKMLRNANEGVVALYNSDDKTSIIEINCETDFVAKNEDFLNFVDEINKLNNHALSNINNLRKMQMSNSKTVDENIVDLISKIGEKITLGRSKSFTNKEAKSFFYQHSVIKKNISKLAVVVSIKSDSYDESVQDFGKKLSMHIAATNPIAVSKNDISQDILDKEKNLIFEEMKSSGKPTEIIEKITKGKINKFINDNSLLSQVWVMDDEKKVQDIINDLNVKNLVINDFLRIKIGE